MTVQRQPGQRTIYVCPGEGCAFFSQTPGKCRSHPYPARAMGPELVPIQMVPLEEAEPKKPDEEESP